MNLTFSRTKFSPDSAAPVLTFTILIGSSLILYAIAALAQNPSHAPPAAPSESVLVIGTRYAPPFAMKDDNGQWTGLSIDLWKHIAEELHLRYRFKETTLEGLIDGTASGELDGAISAITVTRTREEKVDFTQPYYISGLGIAVPSSGRFGWLWLPLRGLISPSLFVVLLGLLGIMLLVSVIVWVLERRANEGFGDPKVGLPRSVWWSASTMAQARTEHQPATVPARLVALLWMAASAITAAVFTASLTAQLTTKQLQGTLHDFSDLKSVRVGACAGTSTESYLREREVGYSTYKNFRDGLEALRKGQIDAFVYDRPILVWLANNEFSGSVEVLDTVFDNQDYAIALPNGSPLRAKINPVLASATQSAWWEELNEKYFGTSESPDG